MKQESEDVRGVDAGAVATSASVSGSRRPVQQGVNSDVTPCAPIAAGAADDTVARGSKVGSGPEAGRREAASGAEGSKAGHAGTVGPPAAMQIAHGPTHRALHGSAGMTEPAVPADGEGQGNTSGRAAGGEGKAGVGNDGAGPGGKGGGGGNVSGAGGGGIGGGPGVQGRRAGTRRAFHPGMCAADVGEDIPFDDKGNAMVPPSLVKALVDRLQPRAVVAGKGTMAYEHRDVEGVH